MSERNSRFQDCEASRDREYEVALQAELALTRIESGEEALGTVWQQMNRMIDESS